MLTQYAWIGWLVLILVFATIEVLTLEFTFLMLALGSVAGLVSGLFGIPWWAQFIIAAVVAVAAHPHASPAAAPDAATRRRSGPEQHRRAHRRRGRRRAHRVADGRPGQPPERRIWTARLSPITEQADVPVGERVLVTGIDGATAVVVPVERSTPSDRISMSATIVLAVVVLAIVIFVLVVLCASIRIIPQAYAGVVERLGRYHKTLTPA